MTAQSDNIVTMGGRDFEIEEPDGLAVIRFLQVVANVGLRAQREAEQFGLALFDKLQGGQVEDGSEGEIAVTVEHTAFLPAVMAFLSVLTEDDFLKLAAAVFQFPTEKEGVTWLRKHGIKLGPLTRALVLNLQQSDDLVEAITNFTGAASGMMLANQIVKTTGPEASAS